MGSTFLGGEFSRLNIASLALASMDMTPVVWGAKEKIEVLNTVASLSGSATVGS